MAKRLLSEDYKNIVFESFKLPKIDIQVYYLDIRDEHYLNNKDLFSRLILAVNFWSQYLDSRIDKTKVEFLDSRLTSIPLSILGIHNGEYISLSYMDEQIKTLKSLKIQQEIEDWSALKKSDKYPTQQLGNEQKILPYEVPEPQETLSFEQLFRSEHREKIPNEVLRLLGPGEADAWQMNENKRIWSYKGPQSAIMIPFFWLRENSYLEIPSKKKKIFITTWLTEFGVKYKSKTFDNPPKDYTAKEHFIDYLKRLKK